MALEWWHWIVLGVALVVAELAVPAFFIIWFGLGALLVGLLLLVAPAMGMTLQLALWCAASLGMVVLDTPDVALALGPCSQPSELRGPTYSGLFFTSVMKNSNES